MLGRMLPHNILMYFTGAICGSGDLNARMRNLAVHHLQNETYLEDNELGTTIANIIESEVR
jgi:hypothetical protein